MSDYGFSGQLVVALNVGADVGTELAHPLVLHTSSPNVFAN